MAVTAISGWRFPSVQHPIPASPFSAFNRASKDATPFLQSPWGSMAASSFSSFVGQRLFLAGAVHRSRRAGSLPTNFILVSPKAVPDSPDSQTRLDPPANEFGYLPLRCSGQTELIFGCSSQEPGHTPEAKKYNRHPQNVDLPAILPKNKKKPYPVPIHKMQRAARIDKKLAQRGVEKHLEPPKNGLLVPELIPVAYQTLDSWKVLIEGLSQLLTVVPVYGCSSGTLHFSMPGWLLGTASFATPFFSSCYTNIHMPNKEEKN